MSYLPRPPSRWSACTNGVHPAPSGSPYAGGLCSTRSCIRCGQHRPLSQLVADQRIRGQRRCITDCNSGATT